MKTLLFISALFICSFVNGQYYPDEYIKSKGYTRQQWDAVMQMRDYAFIAESFYKGVMGIKDEPDSLIYHDVQYDTAWFEKLYHPEPCEIAITLQDLMDYQKYCDKYKQIVGYDYRWNIEHDKDGGWTANSKMCRLDCFRIPGYECQSFIEPHEFKLRMGFNYQECDTIYEGDKLTFDGFIEYMKKQL